MTVIAFRAGVMATDSGVYTSGVMTQVADTIIRVPGGGLASASGSMSDCHRFRHWILQPSSAGDPAHEPFRALDQGFDALLVSPDGAMFTVDSGGMAVRLDAPFAAKGHGWKAAFFAMAAGATAEHAVEIAIQFHDGCHAPVQLAALGRHA